MHHRQTSNEESLAKLHFDKQMAFAIQALKNGTEFWDICALLAAHGLEEDAAFQDMCTLFAAYDPNKPVDCRIIALRRKYRTKLFDLLNDFFFPAQKKNRLRGDSRIHAGFSGFKDETDRQCAAAFIIMNMFERGMLKQMEKAYGRDNLVYHCLYELYW